MRSNERPPSDSDSPRGTHRVSAQRIGSSIENDDVFNSVMKIHHTIDRDGNAGAKRVELCWLLRRRRYRLRCVGAPSRSGNASSAARQPN